MESQLKVDLFDYGDLGEILEIDIDIISICVAEKDYANPAIWLTGTKEDIIQELPFSTKVSEYNKEVIVNALISHSEDNYPFLLERTIH